jgi:hypothetical protein
LTARFITSPKLGAKNCAWLKSPFPVQVGRNAPLIQIFFAGQLKDEEIIAW